MKPFVYSMVGSLFALLLVFGFQALAVTLPGGEALFETSLASRISSTDTSMTLVANSTGGSAVSGYHCFTIDEGRSDAEFVCGTISGTSVTSLERGISYVNGTTTVTASEHIHRAGADVKITDYPLVQRLKNIANGLEQFPNIIYYTASPSYAGISSAAIASKGYVDSVALSGAPNGDDSTKGVYQRATGAQAAAGTASGSTGANLVLGTNIATSTCQIATNSVLVASSTTGKLDANCIATNGNLTYTGSNTFTGANTFASTTFASTATTSLMGTTTIAASASAKLTINTVPTVWPSSQGAANTALTNNGSGTLTWTAPVVSHYSLISTSNFTNGTSTILVIPAGTLTASSTWTATVNGQCSTSSSHCIYYLRDSGGTSLATCDFGSNTVTNLPVFITLTGSNQSSLASQSTLFSGWMNTTGSSSNTLSVCQGIATSAFNTANATNFVIVAQGANTTVNSYLIQINP